MEKGTIKHLQNSQEYLEILMMNPKKKGLAKDVAEADHDWVIFDLVVYVCNFIQEFHFILERFRLIWIHKKQKILNSLDQTMSKKFLKKHSKVDKLIRLFIKHT